MKVRVTRKQADAPIPVVIHTEFIKLQDFLKFCDAVSSGGMAKNFIQNGEILVNGETEVRRGRKLYPGDVVSFGPNRWQVAAHEA